MTKSRVPAKKRRKPRSPLDPVFKQVLTDEFAEYGATLQTEVEIGRFQTKSLSVFWPTKIQQTAD
ncbi:MAG: hypothetical protein DYG89_14230 [Caldilinea sp. CFX5]|nr:hypothetical protein [Caldilinea sp. CFX5]